MFDSTMAIRESMITVKAYEDVIALVESLLTGYENTNFDNPPQ